jgi:eukaryotic-like serine/threonine-protein kinase
MKDATQLPQLIRFEAFEVNSRTGELCKRGDRIRLPEQSFQILALLLERRGQLVTREEIRKKLWPNDTIVEFENSINAAVKKLRTALGDSADEPRYVETLARRGYRWMVPVEFIVADPKLQNSVRPSAPLAQPAPYLIGKRVSHYRVLEVIGGGGMGVVYKAEDLKLGRRVALKFLPAELAHDPAAMERFEREARAASSLNHPNICTIHEVEEHSDQPFLVMELLEGQTLRELLGATSKSIDQGSGHAGLELETLIDIATQTAEGLDAAHKKGIIHRDIKPTNIFVTHNGRAKILDFGLAKLQPAENPEQRPPSPEHHLERSSDVELSQTGIALGTAGYMSPEQVRGEKLDARTDLFSFGLVLYEMATGHRAFGGETAPVVHAAILNQEPVAVRSLNPSIPAKLQQIISQTLEKERHRRYSDAAKLCCDLNSLKKQVEPRNLRPWWKLRLRRLWLAELSGFSSFSRRQPSKRACRKSNSGHLRSIPLKMPWAPARSPRTARAWFIRIREGSISDRCPLARRATFLWWMVLEMKTSDGVKPFRGFPIAPVSLSISSTVQAHAMRSGLRVRAFGLSRSALQRHTNFVITRMRAALRRMAL